MLFLLSKIVFYGVQKLNGKRVLRKIEIIHVQHIVSSVAQKRKMSWIQQFKLKVGNTFQSVLSKIQNRKPSRNSDIQKLKSGL